MNPRPVILEGKRARLEPLVATHAAALHDAGADPEIWRHLPRGPLRGVEDAKGWIAEAMAAAAQGCEVPFAIVALDSGQVAGSTRYLEIRPQDRGLEIGWTWIGAAWQRTAVNTECKYLLLRHAFEDLGAVRVQLKTDARNLRSQTALERIGARREGTLRKHMAVRDGFIRDSVFFSVTDDDWPEVKARLEALLAR